jgi:hypothetical protein
LHVPGASIAIIKDARIAWRKSFGVKDQMSSAPVDDDTIFEAQSMSKPVFAYRVMKLVEQGALKLDAPLTEYTPEAFVSGDSRLKLITARQPSVAYVGPSQLAIERRATENHFHTRGEVVLFGRRLLLSAICSDAARGTHRLHGLRHV